MTQQNDPCNDNCPIAMPCPVEAKTLSPFKDEPVEPCVLPQGFRPIIKVPAVLAETTVQVVVEACIPLTPPASEIKRVLKDVFITQCKLVPVKFCDDTCPGVRTVTRGKLFIEGFIRKDIEYATSNCNGFIRDRIATVPFCGFADLKGDVQQGGDFILFPILGESSESKSRFIDPKHGETPRLDKYFFENSVFYNEQPYCELISADFFEIDFSPCPLEFGETIKELREKLVVDITLKLLQIRQVRVPSLGC
ncbi:CsxC family protein [Psychrobacillus vulpis]|uniref:Uracil permease n=1 Tax=Psychrobacillus vulpis TaxID=2325572 RepID=A0A544TQL2_9BACI|nr:Uracil permease [Psychrobacillus vulpis]TQR19731.1 Uracil permease [Psychrobacillus vulpis]